MVGADHVVLLVRDFDVATEEAVGYLRSFRPDAVHPVTPCPGGAVSSELQERWRRFVGAGIPDLQGIAPQASRRGVRDVVRSIRAGREDFVTVMIPETLRPRGLLSI